MFLLQYGHGVWPHVHQGQRQTPALCLMTRQAQNIQDSAHSLSSGLIIGEMKGSPSAPPHGVLLGLCKASGVPDSPGTWISTSVKGFEYSGSDNSIWDQPFMLPLVQGMPGCVICFIMSCTARCCLSLPFPPHKSPGFADTVQGGFCPVHFLVIHSAPHSLYFMYIQNYNINVDQPVPCLSWKQCYHTTGTAGSYFFLYSVLPIIFNLSNIKSKWQVQLLSLHVLTGEKGLYEYIILFFHRHAFLWLDSFEISFVFVELKSCVLNLNILTKIFNQAFMLIQSPQYPP